jgi:ubiquinone/menaquinone biosynthesis C-methylase UbiE
MRPGGLELTRRLVNAAAVAPGAKLMDVGCGKGATVSSLLKWGYDAAGIDTEITEDTQGLPVTRGSAYGLPCCDAELDGILCECVFSLLASPNAAITEFKRALKHEGTLMMSDLYSRSYGGKSAGMMKNIYTKVEIERFLSGGNFSLEYFEDCSEALKAMFAQLIFDMGKDAFSKEIDTDLEDLKNLKCGYFILVARAEKQSAW